MHAQLTIERCHLLVLKEVSPGLAEGYHLPPVITLPILPYGLTLLICLRMLEEEVEHGQMLVYCASQGHRLILLMQFKRLALIFIDQPLLGQFVVAKVCGHHPLEDGMGHGKALLQKKILTVHQRVADHLGCDTHDQIRLFKPLFVHGLYISLQ